MQTKNLISVALMVIVISLVAVTPVSSDEPSCPDHEATTSSLRACVVHATGMGHIDNPGVVNSLLAKLDAAQAASDRGQPRVAVAQLQAFIHEVEAQAGKHIDEHHAHHMVTHANAVIGALSS